MIAFFCSAAGLKRVRPPALQCVFVLYKRRQSSLLRHQKPLFSGSVHFSTWCCGITAHAGLAVQRARLWTLTASELANVIAFGSLTCIANLFLHVYPFASLLYRARYACVVFVCLEYCAAYKQVQLQGTPTVARVRECLRKLLRALYLGWRVVFLAAAFTPPVCACPLLFLPASFTCVAVLICRGSHAHIISAGVRSAAHKWWWALLRTSVLHAGACTIKFAQWAATRPDLFPQVNLQPEFHPTYRCQTCCRPSVQSCEVCNIARVYIVGHTQNEFSIKPRIGTHRYAYRSSTVCICTPIYDRTYLNAGVRRFASVRPAK
jgi:hypothetical protein